MRFRRGLWLGVLVGVIGIVMGRGAGNDGDSAEAGGQAGAQAEGEGNPLRALIDEAREAVRSETRDVEQRLRDRYTRARETGHLPEEPR